MSRSTAVVISTILVSFSVSVAHANPKRMIEHLLPNSEEFSLRNGQYFLELSTPDYLSASNQYHYSMLHRDLRQFDLRDIYKAAQAHLRSGVNRSLAAPLIRFLESSRLAESNAVQELAFEQARLELEDQRCLTQPNPLGPVAGQISAVSHLFDEMSSREVEAVQRSPLPPAISQDLPLQTVKKEPLGNDLNPPQSPRTSAMYQFLDEITEFELASQEQHRLAQQAAHSSPSISQILPAPTVKKEVFSESLEMAIKVSLENISSPNLSRDETKQWMKAIVQVIEQGQLSALIQQIPAVHLKSMVRPLVSLWQVACDKTGFRESPNGLYEDIGKKYLHFLLNQPGFPKSKKGLIEVYNQLEKSGKQLFILTLLSKDPLTKEDPWFKALLEIVNKNLPSDRVDGIVKTNLAKLAFEKMNENELKEAIRIFEVLDLKSDLFADKEMNALSQANKDLLLEETLKQKATVSSSFKRKLAKQYFFRSLPRTLRGRQSLDSMLSDQDLLLLYARVPSGETWKFQVASSLLSRGNITPSDRIKIFKGLRANKIKGAFKAHPELNKELFLENFRKCDFKKNELNLDDIENLAQLAVSYDDRAKISELTEFYLEASEKYMKGPIRGDKDRRCLRVREQLIEEALQRFNDRVKADFLQKELMRVGIRQEEVGLAMGSTNQKLRAQDFLNATKELEGAIEKERADVATVEKETKLYREMEGILNRLVHEKKMTPSDAGSSRDGLLSFYWVRLNRLNLYQSLLDQVKNSRMSLFAWEAKRNALAQATNLPTPQWQPESPNQWVMIHFENGFYGAFDHDGIKPVERLKHIEGILSKAMALAKSQGDAELVKFFSTYVGKACFDHRVDSVQSYYAEASERLQTLQKLRTERSSEASESLPKRQKLDPASFSHQNSPAAHGTLERVAKLPPEQMRFVVFKPLWEEFYTKSQLDDGPREAVQFIESKIDVEMVGYNKEVARDLRLYVKEMWTQVFPDEPYPDIVP